MRRLLTCAAVAAAFTLAACGSDSDTGAPASAARHETVGVRQVDGMGAVLVDAGGLALYTPDQESDGKIRCTGGCTAFWQPLDAGSGTPTAADGAGRLGVIRRPDGSRQVTLGRKPLYTFSEDAPGKITGDGFGDEFDGQRFTWHVVLGDGGRSEGSSSDSGYGY
jgi:predicted lipoprotein with Yx(FWY)xxD motif